MRRSPIPTIVSLEHTTKAWAEQHRFNPSTVYAVLNGQKKCLRGEAHRAAVLLGIKDGAVSRQGLGHQGEP
ncbi:DNA-binding protein [Pseudomonas bubulae]|nr:DNA-binding protein [Pseudomonas bubulae]MCF3193214.1 DNA-binding protein [Pseudomonas bubulae]